MVMRKLCNENVMINGVWIVRGVLKWLWLVEIIMGVFGLEVGNEIMILCNEMVMRKLCNENVMKMMFGLVWDVMKKIGCEIMKKGM